MKRNWNLVLKYLAVVAISCLLAFVISQTRAYATQATQTVPRAIAIPIVGSPTDVKATVDFAAAGGHDVETALAIWRDSSRKRELPVKLYFPAASSANRSTETFPVVLFSHGLGGSREGGQRWAAHWASHGYVVVAMQHVGSDESLWKGAAAREIAGKMKAGMTLTNFTLRIDDIHFVIDEVIRRTDARDAAFANADPKRLGMSGHSFGAQTTLAVAGQKRPLADVYTGVDARIAAAIAFSPNARNQIALSRQFGDVNLPFFSITGTEDGSILGDGTKPEYRRIPFDNMPVGQKYLAVFEGGDHMVFGGHGFGLRRPETARDKEIQIAVMAGTLAFWNATLKHEVVARDWLEKGDFRAMLIAKDVFEHK